MGWPKGKPRGTAAPIQEEVQTGPDIGGAVGNQNESRVALLQSIADQVDPPAEEAEPVVEEAVAPEAVAPEPEVVPEPPRKHRLKVNGAEVELTEDELIATAQKNLAADDYLAKAKETLAKAKQVAPVAHQQPQVEEDDLALARALQAGSEEEAAQAIRKLRSGPTIDPVKVVDERLAFQKAVEQFRTDYPDIARDPYLMQLAAMEDARLMKDGDLRPYQERYQDIGKKLLGWKATLSPQPSEKLQRKATVTPITAASARAGGAAPEPDEDPKAIVAEMARARGRQR